MELKVNLIPPENWMHVYTDDSKLDAKGSAGAGIHLEHFPDYLPLELARTVLGGEDAAICATLQHLNVRLSLFDQAAVFSSGDPGHC